MRKHYFGVIAIALVAIFVLGACSAGGKTTAVSDTPAAGKTDAEMEALIAEKADGQHTLEFILSKDMTAEEWSETIDKMIGYGAKISPEEKTLIIDWLVNRKK